MPHASFTRVFAAAHRVHNDPGKCANVHGHNYRAKIEVSTVAVDAQGFTIPLDAIKAIVDTYDHALVLDEKDPLHDIFTALPINVATVPFVPSTENMAQALAERVLKAATMRGAIGVRVHVTLAETDSITAFGEATA